jgi:hypothetical protein
MKVFVSHSSKDKAKADLLVNHLEDNNLPCWIAPRNIPPSANYAKEITKAIGACEYIILLLSKDSNASDAVAGEIEMAFNRAKPIIPVRLNEISASPALELFISRSQWVDGFNKSLFHSAQEYLVDALSGESPNINKPPTNSTNNKALTYSVVSIITLSIIGFGVNYYNSESLSNSDETLVQKSTSPLNKITSKQPEVKKSYGLQDLKLALQKGDIDGLKMVLSDELNRKLLFQSEHQFSHTLFLNGLIQNKTNYDEVISFLVAHIMVDLNQLFEINYMLLATNIPQSIVLAYLQNLDALYSRENSFQDWKAKVKQEFGYELPDSWKEIYEDSEFPMDIVQTYMGQYSSVELSLIEFSKLFKNDTTTEYLTQSGINFPDSYINLSNGVRIPFSMDRISELSVVKENQVDWLSLQSENSPEAIKRKEEQDLREKEELNKKINLLINDKNHAQLKIKEALKLNDLDKLRFFHENGVPFNVLLEPWGDKRSRFAMPFFIDAFREAKPEAFEYLIKHNLIDLYEKVTVRFDYGDYPQIKQEAKAIAEWIKDGREKRGESAENTRNNISSKFRAELTKSFYEKMTSKDNFEVKNTLNEIINEQFNIVFKAQLEGTIFSYIDILEPESQLNEVIQKYSKDEKQKVKLVIEDAIVLTKSSN